MAEQSQKPVPKGTDPSPAISLQHLHNMAPTDLKSWKGNARKHSKKQIKEIARSIEEFGVGSAYI